MGDKNQIKDQQIENFLNGEDDISSIYADSKQLKAPQHLEFSVKKMARDAESQAADNTSKKQNSWIIPLSIAATMLMAFIITFDTKTTKVDDKTVIAKKDESKETVMPELQQQEPLISNHPVQPAPVNIVEKKMMIAPEDNTRLKETQVAVEEKKFEMPAHLQDLMQPTGGGSEDELPPAEILRMWTRQQWKQHIIDLKKTGKIELAEKYIQEYTIYYPDHKLDLSE